MASVERQNSIFRKYITVAQDSASANLSTSGKPSRDMPTKEKQPMDWKNIADQLAESGMGDMHGTMCLHQRFAELTKEEILAALDEIPGLGLYAVSAAVLERRLIEELSRKDPEMALTRFIDRIADDRSGLVSQLSNDLKEWARKDPGKAEAWFDQQIAAGKFDGKTIDNKSWNRFEFEGAIIGAILASNPEAAAKRLAAFPEDQRGNILRGSSFGSLNEESQVGFAELVRSQLPEKEQASAISSLAGQLSHSGYEKVTAYLDRIDATPAERKASAEEVAETRMVYRSNNNPVTRQEIDSMRAWVATQSPGSTDNTTGIALGIAVRDGGSMKFSEGLALVKDYSAASGGNEEVLASFLEAQRYRVGSNRDEARALAETLTDVKRREKIIFELH